MAATERQQRGKKRRLSPRVLARLAEHWRLGATPSSALREIETDADLKAAAPSIRTVQDIFREFTESAAHEQPANPGDIATIADFPADAAGFLLDVLRATIERPIDARAYLTKAEVDSVAHVYRAAKTIPPWLAAEFARKYVKRGEGGETTSDLDAFLAYRPWEGSAAANSYLHAISRRLVQVVRPLLASDPFILGVLDQIAQQSTEPDANAAVS